MATDGADSGGVRGADVERESLRLCARYVDEVVLGFNLCPWAEPALRAGRVGRAVCLAERPSTTDVLPFIDRFAAAHDPVLDIGLLTFPRHRAGWAAFDGFAERVRRADRERRPTGGEVPFLIAAFHPGGAQSFEGPHQLVSFLRRTPDPMLQLVRADLLMRVKAAQPEASAEVGRRNYLTLSAPSRDGDGRARFEAVVRAIQTDRDATYARLGVG